MITVLRDVARRSSIKNSGKYSLREISGPGQLRGYRAVWHSLRLKHQIHVPRERAANLRELNPDGTRDISYGPNFYWHVDGKN